MVYTEEYVNIPKGFYKIHKFATLTSDAMFFNGNYFMITSARKLKFVTVEHIPSLTAEKISKNLNKVINFYGMGGFVIHVILMDAEF